METVSSNTQLLKHQQNKKFSNLFIGFSFSVDSLFSFQRALACKISLNPRALPLFAIFWENRREALVYA
jgi:hypothetical protein